jgi:hypothetical protein
MLSSASRPQISHMPPECLISGIVSKVRTLALGSFLGSPSPRQRAAWAKQRLKRRERARLQPPPPLQPIPSLPATTRRPAPTPSRAVLCAPRSRAGHGRIRVRRAAVADVHGAAAVGGHEPRADHLQRGHEERAAALPARHAARHRGPVQQVRGSCREAAGSCLPRERLLSRGRLEGGASAAPFRAGVLRCVHVLE